MRFWAIFYHIYHGYTGSATCVGFADSLSRTDCGTPPAQSGYDSRRWSSRDILATTQTTQSRTKRRTASKVVHVVEPNKSVRGLVPQGQGHAK